MLLDTSKRFTERFKKKEQYIKYLDSYYYTLFVVNTSYTTAGGFVILIKGRISVQSLW